MFKKREKKEVNLEELKENITNKKIEWVLVQTDEEFYGFYDSNPGDYSSKYQNMQSDESNIALLLVEKFLKNEEIEGIMKGKEVDMHTNIEKTNHKGSNNKWDFTPRNIEQRPLKDVWCRQVVKFKDAYPITDEYTPEQLDQFKQEIYAQKCLKIATDRDFEYGDGGSCRLAKPLYFFEKLPLKDSEKDKLKTLLNIQAEKTQDFHETCPVQDIIDPELMPSYNKKIEDHDEYKLQLKEVYSDAESNEDYYEKPQTCANNEFVSLRSEYQWIPTKFQIFKNHNVKILGEIHNLPRKENEQLYHLIASVFQKQIPAYEKLNLLEYDKEKEDSCILQVIVKAQKYIIPPKQKYSGKWHLEGKTEHIVAAGVYYISIDEGFDHDILQYKPLICYDNTNEYYDDMDFLAQWEIGVKDGCSVVFSNTLPHKFDTLTNNSEKPLERLFMNFFIVDPSKPLLDTDYVQDVQNALMKVTSKNVSKNIMQFLGFEFDMEKGKEKRKLVRENANKEVSGWGYVFYGNSGDVEFIDSFAANVTKGSYYDEIEKQ